LTHDPFYWSLQWRAVRAAFIKSHPTCSTPGCGLPTTHVDHVLRRTAGGADYAEDNLRGYCTPCHNRKTAGHDKPRRHGDYEAQAPGCDANGQPIDPTHHWHR